MERRTKTKYHDGGMWEVYSDVPGELDAKFLGTVKTEKLANELVAVPALADACKAAFKLLDNRDALDLEASIPAVWKKLHAALAGLEE